MRLITILLILFTSQFETYSQETEPQSNTDLPENSITFTCTSLLVSEPGKSDFTVSGDTVSFTLYYVDITCNEYTYKFEREGKSLIVRRVTKSQDGCDKEAEQLYGFEGKMIHVPSGKHLFELESLIGDSKNTIFREVIKVK
jgi:hypothetical protein